MISAIAAGQKTADTGAQALEKKKLTDAAQQFEAVFLQELLKPMRAGSGADAEGSEDADAVPGADTMSSYGTEALATALAKGGGMGIARQIVAKVSLEKAQHLGAGLPVGGADPTALSRTSVPFGAVQKKD